MHFRSKILYFWVHRLSEYMGLVQIMISCYFHNGVQRIRWKALRNYMLPHLRISSWSWIYLHMSQSPTAPCLLASRAVNWTRFRQHSFDYQWHPITPQVAREGEISRFFLFDNANSDLYSVSVTSMLYAISCYIGLRYNHFAVSLISSQLLCDNVIFIFHKCFKNALGTK